LKSNDYKTENFSTDLILTVWQKGKTIQGFDPTRYRTDSMGFVMVYERYNTRKEFGWELEYIILPRDGGTATADNLIPLQWENKKRKQDERIVLNIVRNKIREAKETVGLTK
jgi:hypothetical protein